MTNTVSMSSLSSQRQLANGVPDRGALAARLPKDWTPEVDFRQMVINIGRIQNGPGAKADLDAALNALVYYGLVQSRGTRFNREWRAMDPEQRQSELVEAATRRPVMVMVKDEFGDEKPFPVGEKADAESRRVRGVRARQRLAEMDAIQRDALL